jgi:basic membrane protein A
MILVHPKEKMFNSRINENLKRRREMKRTSLISVLLLTAVVLLIAACAPAATPTQAVVEEPAPVEEATEAPAATEVPAGPVLKLAAVLPGVITDADYNTMAYLGTEAVKNDLGLETTYSESVPVPDVDRVMREYIDAGYNVIWTHGGQFVTQTLELAKAFPDVYFIAEGDALPEDMPENVWFVDRNFHNGFYGVGALAARASQTGKVGYLGGLTLPFSYAEVHAIQQAFADSGLDVELKPVWAGDFNDPAKARQVADAMIAEGVDVIIGSLNLGMQGVFESVKSNTGPKILVTAKYSDKSQFAPDNYLTSLIYDFSGPLKDIITKIQAGEKGGYYPLGYDTGVQLQTPLQNVPESVSTEMEQVIADLISGKIQVVKDVSEIK